MMLHWLNMRRKYSRKYWVPLAFLSMAVAAFFVFPAILGMAFTVIYLFGFMAIQVLAFFGIFFWYLAGRIRVAEYMPGDLDLTWDDYRGQPIVVGKAKAWVRYLRGAAEFERMGGQFQAGVLMSGPPGSGKTYLAKVMAAEAGIPFLSVDAASLLGTFIGIGPLKVGRLFGNARHKAEEFGAAILFIDELDSIGGSRGGMTPQGPMGVHAIMPMMGMSGQILNTLLTELDGLAEKRSRIWRLRRRIARWVGEDVVEPPVPRVMVIGSTNRPDILSKALTRPGRLGKLLHIDIPNKDGTTDIARYYLGKIKAAEDLTVQRVARDAMRHTPATIKFGLNDAVQIANMEGLDQVEYRHWRRAVSEMVLGSKQPMPLSERERRMLAVHEGGHAIVSLAVMRKYEKAVVFVSLERYGQALGHMLDIEEVPWQIGWPLGRMEGAIMVSMAGACAELVFDKERHQSMGGDLPAVLWRMRQLAGNGVYEYWPQESEDENKIRELIHEHRLRLWKDTQACLKQNAEAHAVLVEALMTEPYEMNEEQVMAVVGDRIVPWQGHKEE